MSGIRLVLASASPARLATLRAAGVEPLVEVSHVDESVISDVDPATMARTLARLKGEAVAARLGGDVRGQGGRVFVLGCDSVLDVDGVPHGKPESAAVARRRLAGLRGRSAVLHTGHYLRELGTSRSAEAVASTTVRFGDYSADEISAYVDTGEPQHVAGAFTIDGLGGAFVDGVDGDPHNVVGISLPLLRRMLADAGVRWHHLWKATD